MEPHTPADNFVTLERSVLAALESYSNVHRGRGHYSMATTHLYEQAREIVLEYLSLDKRRYVVIFCTAARAVLLTAKLEKGSYTLVTGRDTGLPLGVTALAVKRKALTKETPFQAGGGTARLYSAGWVIWADPPDRFEAGTPAIINVIAFAKALRMVRQQGKSPFSLGPIEDHPNADHSISDRTAREILYHDDLEGYAGEELLTRLRPTLIGYNKVVPTTSGDKPFINLDNGASTPTFAPVWEAVCKTWRQTPAVQQEIIREVRSVCAGFLGAPQEKYDIIFTSNTTEAINLVAEKLSHENFGDTETVILNTLLEHSSNEFPWRMVPGFSLIRLGVDVEGFIDMNELENLLKSSNQEGLQGKKRIRLVAVSGASNILGSFNNLEEISRIVHKYGARLLVDAAQMVAHRTVNMEAAGIDYLAFSAHKMYAPFGTGALVVKKEIPGFSAPETEMIRASGEENVAGIAAMGKAIILLQRIGMELIREEEQALTKHALRKLSQIPGLTLFGIKDPASPHIAQKGGVILFNLKGMMATRLATELALQGGIGTRSGCHCAHMMIKHLLHFTPALESAPSSPSSPSSPFPDSCVSASASKTQKRISTT
jgi:selenocysteine lyase/cysteine desulfurase